MEDTHLENSTFNDIYSFILFNTIIAERLITWALSKCQVYIVKL